MAILFLLAVISLALMTLSPTIYASANRVVAVYSVILLFILGNLFHSLKDKIPTPVFMAVGIVAILNIILLNIEWGGGFFCYW
jgi:hypothetical protein